MTGKFYLKTILLFMIALMWLVPVKGQTKTADTRKLICKTWHLYKYKNDKDVIYNVTPEMEASYIKYNTDGTFEDKETRGTYTGKWVYNTATKTITQTQTQSKDYPAKMELKILTITETEMDAEANDFTSGIMTIYMKPGE